MNDKEFDQLLSARKQPPKASFLEARIIEQAKHENQHTVAAKIEDSNVINFSRNQNKRWLPAAAAASVLLCALIGLNVLHQDQAVEHIDSDAESTFRLTDFHDAVEDHEELLLENFYES